MFWTADVAGPGQTLLRWGDGLAGARLTGLRLVDAEPGKRAKQNRLRHLLTTLHPVAP